MLDGMFMFLIFFVITWAIYGIFDLLIRKKERIMLIERDNYAPLQQPYGNPFPARLQGGTGFGSLKGACLLMGLGLGFLTGFLINCAVRYTSVDQEMVNRIMHRFEEIIMLASIFLFAGVGLLVSFIIERIIINKQGKK